MKPYLHTCCTVCLAGIAAVLPAGCSRSGPASTNTSSTAFTSLQKKVDFLQRYVTFRRTYETLDFAVIYSNGGGTIPGPSDWDIRLIATVPASELQAWTSQGTRTTTVDTEWLNSLPTTLERSGLNEWYVNGQTLIGVDRDRRIVAYRNAKR